jgi:hypothetical protein
MNKIYTGVGSRETPLDIIREMHLIAKMLASNSYILRSGGADGADSAFEQGCDEAEGKKEIYLPWQGFNNSKSQFYTVSKDALLLAATIHPCWDSLSQGAAKLHGRNCYQVMGRDLETPSAFLVCWTKNGELVGGTRTAIKLAERHKIPIYNLFFPDAKHDLYEMIHSFNINIYEI